MPSQGDNQSSLQCWLMPGCGPGCERMCNKPAWAHHRVYERMLV